jgi:hypothetical protein
VHLRATLVRLLAAVVMTAFSIAGPISVKAQNVCSVSKTNTSCVLTVDRSNPVAPPAIQMYSDQTLTVIIEKPLPFERYFLDFSTGQATVAPDQASAIVTALSGNLAKLTELSKSGFIAENEPVDVESSSCLSLHPSDPAWPARGDVAKELADFKTCFAELGKQAIPIYSDLEPVVMPDALTSKTPASMPEYFSKLFAKNGILSRIDEYVKKETIVSTKIASMAKAPFGKEPPRCTAAELAAKPPTCQAPPPVTYSMEDERAITELSDYQKVIDAVSADLAGYELRINDLGQTGYIADGRNAKPWDATATYLIGQQVLFSGKCFRSLGKDNKNFQPATGKTKWRDLKTNDGACPLAVVISSRQDNSTIYQSMVTRTITYSLDFLNLVSYSQETAPTAANKKSLGSIAINFADKPNNKGQIGKPYSALRWEASAGVFFSTLPNRTFLAIPNSSGSSGGSSTTTYTVQESKTRPTPVPFAAANYRLTSDFGRVWKQNIYATLAVGVNPNDTSAEFGVGPSYAWRALMVSAFLHIAHDTTAITTVSPSGNPPAYPTQWHWSPKFAIGLSVRVPSLTGR